MQHSWRDLARVPLTAARLLAAHWPALLTLALAGVAVRNAALWAAVVVSDHNALLGQIVLLIAPLGYLLPIVAMMHVVRGSLPHLAALHAAPGPIAVTEGRERRLVDVAVSVLVPFFAVYVAYGLLEEDRLRFTNEAAFDEFNSALLPGRDAVDFGERLGIYSLPTMVAIVAVAWVLRWALGRFERRTSFLALAFVGALVEVYYTGQAARYLSGATNLSTTWVEDRAAFVAAEDRYRVAVDHLGPLTRPVEALTSWLGSVAGTLDAVVVVPLAWLTVGAVVLGHRLSPPAPADPHPGWQRVPAPVRRVSGSLLADIRERWSAGWGGIRMLMSAGLMPTLVFCLVFLVVLRIPLLFSYAVRWLTGPHKTDEWLAFSPIESGLGLALSMALLATLLAAAVEWLVTPQVTTAATTRQTPASQT